MSLAPSMIAVSSSGKSFRALAAYLANGRTGQEQDRVAWRSSRNLPTDDPELAATFMRATAARSDRIEKPVYHVVLSFDPGDAIDRATMERVADRILERLGLAEHQAIIVAHRDRAHAHLHLLVNRVHPETGKAWERWKDQPRIQEVLRQEERALGLREVPGRLAPLDSPNPELPGLESRAHEADAPSALRRLSRELAAYETVVDLNRKGYAAQLELHAARVRLHEREIAAERAQATESKFMAALAAVYRNPEQARIAFVAIAETRGLTEATRLMRERPEEFGKLVETYRSRPFGIGPSPDTGAREAAPDAARKGQEALNARIAPGIATTDRSAHGEIADRAAEEECAIRNGLKNMPARTELEIRISRALERLLPREVHRLKLLLTAPQAALMERLRSTARDVLLGREEER